MPHIHDLYDFTVAVFIVHEGRVLLVEHPRYNKWLPIGGHIELHEDPEEALYREIEEECGLPVELLPTTRPVLEDPAHKPLPTPHFLDVYEANAPHKHISLTYFARALSDKAILSSEHTALVWISEGQLDDPKYDFAQDIRFYCRQALAMAARSAE